MKTNKPKSIVASYVDELRSVIPSEGSQNLAFRGLENKDWGLESAASQRHASQLTHSDFIEYNCELITKGKKANYHQKENRQLTDIELLAELQHYGAATALIDFTRDFLIALWFASGQWIGNGNHKDGKVIIVNTGDPDVFLRLTSKDEKKSLEEILEFETHENQALGRSPDVDASTSKTSGQKKGKLWYWQPESEIKHCLSAQKGVFIFGQAVIQPKDIQCWEVTVSNEHKRGIRRELSVRFGIDEDSLFDSLPSFAAINGKDHKIQTKTAHGYHEDAVDHDQGEGSNQTIQSIDNAIRLVPDKADCNYSHDQVDQERLEDALKDINRAIEQEPEEADSYMKRSLINHRLERYEDALKDIDSAIELEPDTAYYYCLRGLINHELERHADALQDVTRAIELGPREAYYYYLHGLANRDLGRYEDALKDVTRAIELEPHDTDARYYGLRSQINHDLERHEDALKDINRAIDQEPDADFYHYLRGLINRDLERHEDALVDIYRAIEQAPKEAYYYFLHGLINRDLERHEDALKDVTRAIELEPDNTASCMLTLRSVINSKLERYEDALKDINRVIELEPDNVDLYRLRSMINRNLGRYEDALKDINRVIEQEPGDAGLYKQRCLVNHGLERYEDIVKDINRVIELEPDEACSYGFRGQINRELERHEDALNDVTRAIELEPHDADSYSVRSLINHELGRHVEAQQDFDQAKRLQSNSSEL